MNEVLLTRGDARGLPDPWIIMTRYNCVLMHPTCHENHGHTYDGRVACVRQIIGYEKPEKVIEWLKDIRPVFWGAVGLVDEAIRMVERVRRNNNEKGYYPL